MPSTTLPPRTDDAQAVAVTADPEAAQRADEASTAVVLLASLVGFVGGTQLLVDLLERLA